MVRILNQSRNTEVVERGRMADNSWTRLRLIGVARLPQGDNGFVIDPCRGVHCMFIRSRRRLPHVDKQHTVVAPDRAIKPWPPAKSIGTASM